MPNQTTTRLSIFATLRALVPQRPLTFTEAVRITELQANRLRQLMANTLEQYGISIQSAATGVTPQAPVIPGLTQPKPPEPPKPISVNPTTPPPQ